MGLRAKFALALAIAALLPLAVGFVVLQTFGFEHLLKSKAREYEAEARALSRSLESAVESQSGSFWGWVSADPTLQDYLAEDHGAGLADPKEIDKQWASMKEDDPLLRQILGNPGATSLLRFTAARKAVAEVIVADPQGRLAAASRKTSDYDQSDEAWFTVGRNLPEGSMWADVLHFDDSAGVFSLDVVLPIHRRGELKGVAKLVLDVTPLFQQLRTSRERDDGQLEILLPDGRILARSGDSGYQALGTSIDAESLMTIRVAHHGWALTKAGSGEERMTGFASIQSRSVDRRKFEPGGYVLFSSPRTAVTAPLRRQISLIGLGAGAATLLCLLSGYALVSRKILKPIAVLGQAARSVAATARLRNDDGHLSENEAFALRKTAEEDLQRIQSIHTGDEVQELAEDFGAMTDRVMRYHRELEAEVDSKTSLIREELEMAREFQNALMPNSFPETPAHLAKDPLRLGFAHFYQPASTVGGDFFDLVELDEHRTGVLIADVMGHGARSALVTAILRALVRNHVSAAADPGAFLGLLNRGLCEVIERSHQTLFVTAFFMVMDTRDCKVSWAVAGHPSPLRARRSTGNPPQLLWSGAQRQPALGLLGNSVYQTANSPIRAGDVFLLYTDGVVEAENPGGKDFGIQRLITTFDEALDGPLAAMPAKIVCEVAAFQKRKHHDDDVCVVAVEVSPGAVPDIAADPAALAGARQG